MQPVQQSTNHLLITRKYREWIAGALADANSRERLMQAPTKRKHVVIDLADDSLRSLVERASNPFLIREEARVPPALVGAARKVCGAIARYELRRSNLDLFEDGPHVAEVAERL